MYKVIYVYPVPKKHVNQFLSINQQASAIYKEHGALDEEHAYLGTRTGDKYGCIGIAGVVETKDDEVIILGSTTFRDKEHHDGVMQKVDADERIDRLYGEITKVIDVSRVVRGEFEQISRKVENDE